MMIRVMDNLFQVVSWTLARTTRLTAHACLILETRLSVKCAPFESDAEDFDCLSVDFGTYKLKLKT